MADSSAGALKVCWPWARGRLGREQARAWRMLGLSLGGAGRGQVLWLGAEVGKFSRKRPGLWIGGFIPKTCGKLCACMGDRPTAATLRHWLKNDQNAPCGVVFGVDDSARMPAISGAWAVRRKASFNRAAPAIAEGPRRGGCPGRFRPGWQALGSRRVGFGGVRPFVQAGT